MVIPSRGRQRAPELRGRVDERGFLDRLIDDEQLRRGLTVGVTLDDQPGDLGFLRRDPRWPAAGGRPRRAVAAGRGYWCQGVVELGPGADSELAEHLVQVVVDGALADVQAGGDLG